MIEDELLTWTVSNLFYCPLFKIGRSNLDKQGFINSYLFNAESFDEQENTIHLLFKPYARRSFNTFLEQQREKNLPIIGEEDYEGGLVLLSLALPAKFEKDYELIWQGAYSKLSREFMKTIPSYVRYTTEKGTVVTDMTVQHMVFTKYQPLKRHWEKKFNVVMDDEQELWSKPTVESETFKLENHVKSLATSS